MNWKLELGFQPFKATEQHIHVNKGETISVEYMTWHKFTLPIPSSVRPPLSISIRTLPVGRSCLWITADWLERSPKAKRAWQPAYAAWASKTFQQCGCSHRKLRPGVAFMKAELRISTQSAMGHPLSGLTQTYLLPRSEDCHTRENTTKTTSVQVHRVRLKSVPLCSAPSVLAALYKTWASDGLCPPAGCWQASQLIYNRGSEKKGSKNRNSLKSGQEENKKWVNHFLTRHVKLWTQWPIQKFSHLKDRLAVWFIFINYYP